MKKYRALRWLTLWLALVLVLPAAAGAEAEQPDGALLLEGIDVPGETVSELGESAVLEIGEDVILSNTLEKTAVPAASSDMGGSGNAPSIGLEYESLRMGVKEKRQLTLKGGVSPQSVGAVFTSSCKKVAKVDRNTGLITARRRGAAIIKMTAADGSVSTCRVDVWKAPSSIVLSERKLTLGVGEAWTLNATLPRKSASRITYSASNNRVVSVDDQGNILPLKKGTAKIVARTFNGKKAVCRVTVRRAPRSVAFAQEDVYLWDGESVAANVRMTKNSGGSYVLTSDNPSVVTVIGGKLKAVGAGTATITVTTYNGLTATMTVQVRRKPVYRALLIGECTFLSTTYCDLPGKTDVWLMEKILNSTKGPAEGEWIVTTRFNRTSTEICGDIREAFSDAGEDDVSLFYISTHGDEKVPITGSTPEYAGYLMVYPDPDERITDWYDKKALTLPCLAAWLKQVPGRVVVIIDSCGSGAAVYGNGSRSAGTAFSPGAFDGAVVKAFRSADDGVVVPNTAQGAFVLKNKFYVLTSAGYQEACWTDDGKYSYFTRWLAEGIGTKGKMPADANENRRTTLAELYQYISCRSQTADIRDRKGGTYHQHVQVYPSDSGFELFFR